MPRSLRLLLTALAFAVFFIGTLALGAVLFPLLFLLALGNGKRHRARCTRFVSRGYGTFLFCLKAWGLIGYGARLSLPEELEGEPFVLVANHPSLIDVLFLLHWFPGTTCVVKSAWRNNFFFGPLLRSVDYLPNHHPKDDAFTGALERMKAHVRKGHPLIVFPEGTRSHDTKLHRFRRGAFEVAAECKVPVLVMFIGVDPPTLAKGESFSHRRRGEFTFEVLDVLRGDDSRALKAEAEKQIGVRFNAFITAAGRLEAPAAEVAAAAS